MNASLFTKLAQMVTTVRDPAGSIQTTQLLDTCRQLVHIIEKFGTAFAMVKSDVGGNIDRLAAAHDRNPSKFRCAFDIITDEVARAQEHSASSDTNGLLWLNRALEFTNALLLRLYEDREVALSTAASDAYTATLYKHHRWYTAAAFTVALKLVPTRSAFFEKFGTPGQQLMTDMKHFVDAFAPILAQIHQFLVDHNLDFPDLV